MMRVGSVPEKMSTGFLGTSPDDYRIRRSAALSSDSAQNKERNGNNMSLTSVNKLENNTVELLVQVSEEQFQDALMKAYKKKVKTIALPGFRKGKAPKAMIEKMYGKEFFYDDAINMVYPAAYEAAVEEAGIEPVDRANVSDLKVEQGNGFNFKATVTVKPDVTVKNYKGIKAEKTIETIMADDVNAELERMRERNSRLTNVERAAKNGDTALIDFEGFKDGIPCDGGKAEKFPLEIGSGQFIPGFEEQLVGMKAEESKEIQVTFPENYHAEELAGAPVTFKVTVHEIKAKELPEINDDLIKEANIKDVETVEAYREYAKKNLSEQKKRNAENEYNNAILSKLCEVCPVEIPQVMIDDEVEYLYRDFASRIQSQGFTIDQFKAMTGQSEESIREELAKDAASKVNIRLVLEAIAKAEKIEASEAECDEEIKRIAGLYGMDEKVVRERIGDQVKYDVCNRKALDLVKESAGK